MAGRAAWRRARVLGEDRVLHRRQFFVGAAAAGNSDKVAILGGTAAKLLRLD